MLLQLSHFCPLYSPPPCTHILPALGSYIHGSYTEVLASPIPVLVLISASISSFSPFPLPNGNHPNYLHIYDSVFVLIVCLVCFLDSNVDSCECIAILVFIIFIFFFFLDKAL